MIKTFNRNPVNFGKPSQNADNIKHANTFKFKGVIDDKNFLNVDQDSFADSLNVYVDSEDILRSRPSLKEQKIIVKLKDGDVVLSNIINVKSFSDVIVYESSKDGKYYLTFVNEDFEEHLQVECEQNIKLVLADKKIFVFAENSLNYYDTDNNKYFDAEKFIYKPITKYFVDNVESKDAVGESSNILTQSDIYSYIFTNVSGGDYSQMVGNEVIVELNNRTYSFIFKENNNYVFIDKFTTSNKMSNPTRGDVADPNILGIGGRNHLLVSISENGVYVASEYELLTKSENGVLELYKEYTYHYFYSVNGLLYNKLPDLEGVICDAKVSHNGYYAVTMKKDAPYIISILDTTGSTTGTYKYPTWTNLFTVLGHTTTYDFDSGNAVPDRGPVRASLVNTTTINLDVVDDENFVIVYGKSPLEDVPLYDKLFYPNTLYNCAYKSYMELECVYCVNRVFKTKTITKTYPQEVVIDGNNGTSNINMCGFRSDSEYHLEIKNCYCYGDNNEAIVEFDWALKDMFNDIVLSGNVNTNLYNESNTQLDSYYPRRYDELVNIGDYSTYLFSIKAKFNSSTNIDLVLIPGYYFYDNNYGTQIVHGLTADENKRIQGIVYVGHKPQIKMDKIGLDKFSIIGSCYGIGTHVLSNNSMNSTKLNFNIFDNHSDVNRFNEEDVELIVDTWNSQTPSVITTLHRSPLADGLYTKLYNHNGLYYCLFNVFSYLANFNTVFNYFSSNIIKEENSTYTEYYAYLGYDQSTGDKPLGYSNTDRYVFSNNGNYLLSNEKIYKFKYTFDFNNPANYNINILSEVDLLIDGYPLYVKETDGLLESIMYYDVNTNNNIATIYKTPEKVELKIENKRENNYLLPSYIGELENYYFANNEKLYISQGQIDENNKFMWYFPENQRQIYNYNITNLHPISTTEMAVFFKDEIRYITYDSNVGNYRDIKTRLDIGCKPGSDVITTYDSKYTLFTTERGLVAMSYQEFISSTEQALSYLSDNIYDIFTKYIENGQVKLHKYGFWIFVYRQDRKEGYLFDLRTNSWWPIECINNVQKLYNYNGKLFVLSMNTVLKPDTSDVNYYDFVNKLSTIIPWRIRSQKMYLGAANYNKLVFNMTFSSVHDLDLLEKANIPITETTFKLQVQNYRKVITGDIGTESSKIVNYNVNAARTYVQRMNYGNVNEFEYLLSYDDKAEYHIPLSLSSISIKYKIGGPVR